MKLPPRVVPIALIIPILVVVGVMMRPRGAAHVPTAFDPAVTLAQAVAAAKGTPRPVLVFGTADWCAPCQALKRGALADRRVSDWIKANTQPVYLDIDKSRDTALELGIMSIPVIILIRDDKIIDQVHGVHGADELLAWLQRAR